MKNIKIILTAAVLVTCFSLLLFSEVFAQGMRTPKGPATTKGVGTLPAKDVGKVVADGGTVLKLQKILGLGRRGYVKTPEYRTSLGTPATLEKDWCQITLNYVTVPDWIDDLTFQFYAVSEAVIDGKKVYSFYKGAVRYSDVERGQHVLTMFLRPSALKRFGDLFAIAVEVSYQGKIIDTLSVDEQKLGNEWWKNPAVVENPNVVMRDGYLISRAQSPFALISAEGYEFSR